MTCVNCSNGIERTVSKLQGLQSAKVNFASGSGEFEIDSTLLDKNTIIEKIKKLGYGVLEDLHALEVAKQEAYEKLKQLCIISALITACLFALMFFPLPAYNSYATLALASLVQFYPGARFYKLAFAALSHRNYDMNVLVAIGTSAAYFYSAFVVIFPELFAQHLRFVYFDGASVIITFVLFGRLLEERSRAKATDFLKKIIDLAPLHANLLQQGEIQQIEAIKLQIDDIVLIKQGEKIPTDGIIVEGKAEIDTSMITGEPMPVFKTIGDSVIAGCINTTGILKVRVNKNASDTTLARIIALMSEATSKKMPIARFADKVSNIFVPTVITISLLTFFVWSLLIGDTMSGITAAISVLIISCPCALGLATPISIVGAVGKGASEGILIKNPEILEIIKDIKYAVFDKTGTLTQGKISVKKMEIPQKYLSVLASVELQSEHPISQAIVRFAKDQGVVLDKTVQDMQILAGLGVRANTDLGEILIGNIELLEQNGTQIDGAILRSFNETLQTGSGVVLVSIDATCKGFFVLEDSLKPHAKEMVQTLKENDITPVLLTGDNEITAKSVAQKIGIDLVYAGVMPDEKYAIIKELQHNAKVMFVGDGINDSISIKQADIGIALNSGSEITKDAGDIILINNDLLSVSKSINLSKKAMRNIKQNLFWAFFYNTLGIPLAAGVAYPFLGVMLNPMYAGIAMSFSSVTVVLNSLRLKFAKLT